MASAPGCSARNLSRPELADAIGESPRAVTKLEVAEAAGPDPERSEALRIIERLSRQHRVGPEFLPPLPFDLVDCMYEGICLIVGTGITDYLHKTAYRKDVQS